MSNAVFSFRPTAILISTVLSQCDFQHNCKFNLVLYTFRRKKVGSAVFLASKNEFYLEPRLMVEHLNVPCMIL